MLINKIFLLFQATKRSLDYIPQNIGIKQFSDEYNCKQQQQLFKQASWNFNLVLFWGKRDCKNLIQKALHKQKTMFCHSISMLRREYIRIPNLTKKYLCFVDTVSQNTKPKNRNTLFTYTFFPIQNIYCAIILISQRKSQPSISHECQYRYL